jgi:hypothetical protein
MDKLLDALKETLPRFFGGESGRELQLWKNDQ